MAISAIGAAKSAGVEQQKVFREADFMKIMLSELAQQDPFEPQETSKIVETEMLGPRNSKFVEPNRSAVVANETDVLATLWTLRPTTHAVFYAFPN